MLQTLACFKSHVKLSCSASACHHNPSVLNSDATLVRGGCRKKVEEEIDPEQLRKDLERLEMIKAKRWVQAASHLCSAHDSSSVHEAA
jgi:hypothetical protein